MTRKKKEQIVCPITKIECDSKQEMYFIWWMVDLKKSGYIESFKRASSQTLSENISYTDTSEKKVKTKILLQSHVYTPDFVIHWAAKAEHIFFCYQNNVSIKGCPFIVTLAEPFSLVEIKGLLNASLDKGSLSKFQVNRKWLNVQKNLYVELVEVVKLFTQTFTPERYTKTDKGFAYRKIQWVVRNVNDYVNIRLKK